MDQICNSCICGDRHWTSRLH